MKALDICDFPSLRNSYWIEFWKGEHREAALAAVDTAKRGGVGQFVYEHHQPVPESPASQSEFPLTSVSRPRR